MPKRQSTAAKKARNQQRATGGKYTELLRNQSSPELRLAAVLRTIGQQGLAERIDAAMAPDPEYDRLEEIYAEAEALSYGAWQRLDDAPSHTPAVERRRLRAEAERRAAALKEAKAALEPYWLDYELHLHDDDHLLIRGVVLMLAHAGKAANPAPFAQAAADALHAAGDWLWLSDAIRYLGTPRRRDARVPEWLSLVDALTGPDAPQQASAREACRLLAEAARMPSRGDEDWTACAELTESAAALARAAAGGGH
ncbi:hypothetical protein [Streptomyces griseosporeus]|uniref:hypothetical protein n=1 Tax=Streptomyces griseosporeus TaxID=1910 RepID=UPI0036A19F14